MNYYFSQLKVGDYFKYNSKVFVKSYSDEYKEVKGTDQVGERFGLDQIVLPGVDFQVKYLSKAELDNFFKKKKEKNQAQKNRYSAMKDLGMTKTKYGWE